MSRLFLLFRIGTDRYAIDANEVAEVLGLVSLKRIPAAPQWVAGLLARRGHMVPVIDIAAMTTGQQAALVASTRTVLVHYRRDGQTPRLLGLRLEGVTDTLRCEPAEFVPAGVDAGTAPWLGPVRRDAAGIVQWVDVQRLLPAAAHALLFPDAARVPARQAADHDRTGPGDGAPSP